MKTINPTGLKKLSGLLLCDINKHKDYHAKFLKKLCALCDKKTSHRLERLKGLKRNRNPIGF